MAESSFFKIFTDFRACDAEQRPHTVAANRKNTPDTKRSRASHNPLEYRFSLVIDRMTRSYFVRMPFRRNTL